MRSTKDEKKRESGGAASVGQKFTLLQGPLHCQADKNSPHDTYQTSSSYLREDVKGDLPANGKGQVEVSKLILQSLHKLGPVERAAAGLGGMRGMLFVCHQAGLYSTRSPMHACNIKLSPFPRMRTGCHA